MVGTTCTYAVAVYSIFADGRAAALLLLYVDARRAVDAVFSANAAVAALT